MHNTIQAAHQRVICAFYRLLLPLPGTEYDGLGWVLMHRILPLFYLPGLLDFPNDPVHQLLPLYLGFWLDKYVQKVNRHLINPPTLFSF